MNINQAKAVAGIGFNVSGRAGLLAANAHCKAAIVAARKAGNDQRAAELSEAQQTFKRRLRRNSCEVCGQPIAAKATHCRIHQQEQPIKALPSSSQQAPPDAQAPKRQRKNANPRIDVAPEGGTLARLGFFAPTVQKTVRKLQATLGNDTVESYFRAVASAVVDRESELRLPFVPHPHWPAVFELGSAIAQLMSNNSDPAAWLLRFPLGVATDGQFDSWQQIQAKIKAAGGPDFTPANLRQTYKRLRLITPAAIASQWRKFKLPVVTG